MKRCCKRNKKFFGKNKNYLTCSKCKHIYCNEYPVFTLQCKCGLYPLIKVINLKVNKNELYQM